ncbi:MAG: adenosylcobinamide-phosphate synthase CbiB [Tahibacter sp.]
MDNWILALFALLLDHYLGEPRRWHPLVGFGQLVRRVETACYADARGSGVFAVAILIVPATLLVAWIVGSNRFGPAVSVLLLYLCIGLRSLGEHAVPVAVALEYRDLQAARVAVGRFVSRDTLQLDETRIAAAATESVLENGNDALFATLFWFAVAGAAGAVMYRIANTLDSMWGYRDARYERYGWAAARFDDLLNFIPARLTALTYACLGSRRAAFDCWRTQAPAWDSPNAGPVMAAGAGALGVQLGGAASYAGAWHERPRLGCGDVPDAESIRRALQLVNRGAIVWILVLAALAQVPIPGGWFHA